MSSCSYPQDDDDDDDDEQRRRRTVITAIVFGERGMDLMGQWRDGYERSVRSRGWVFLKPQARWPLPSPPSRSEQ